MPKATFATEGLDEKTWVAFAALSSGSVLQWRLIDGVAAYDLVYAALGASRQPRSISGAE